MKASRIAQWVAVFLAAATVAGCASGNPKTAALQGVVEAGLEAKLEVLSNPENLERIEAIADAVMKAEATRKLARELAAGAVLGLSDAAQEEALRAAVSGFVDAFAAALGGEGGEGLDADLDALLRDAASSAALGVLGDPVREQADRFAGDLSRTVAAALTEEIGARLPAILDASFRRVSPRLGETIERDVAPALASALTGELAPALAASLEQSLGPALEALLAERLLPAIDRAASERLPPLLRASTREAMLGFGDALEGELGGQARAFMVALVKESKQDLGSAIGAKSWMLPAAAIGLLATILAGVYFWRRAREQQKTRRARESALFLVTNTINRLPEDLQARIKSSIADAGRKGGDGRTGGAELQLFLDRHNL